MSSNRPINEPANGLESRRQGAQPRPERAPLWVLAAAASILVYLALFDVRRRLLADALAKAVRDNP
jgi:hypothetical protein